MSHWENRARQLRADIEKFRKRQADFEDKAAKADAKALDYDSQADRATNPGSAKSKRKQGADKRKEASKHRQDAAKASQAVAKATKDLHAAEGKIREEQQRDAKRDQQKQRSQEQRDLREQQRLERQRQQKERRERAEQERRERERDQEVAGLRSRASNLEDRLARASWANSPDEITVLFIASSPEDQEPLRLDQEVREIQHRVRASKHRDSVKFEYRPAARSSDLFQMLNEVRPHVVHFSGHGDQHALCFEDNDGTTKPLSNDQLAAVLSVASDRIRLVIFNSCDSAEQAALACEFLDAAIGMDQPVSDEASKVFAGQFYNALGFGLSLDKAFEQARAQVHVELGATDGEPRLHTASEVEASEVYLVAPPNGGPQ